MVRRAARWVLTRPELLIPAKNDKADKFAAEQGESHQSCKMQWKQCSLIFSVTRRSRSDESHLLTD